MKNKNREFTVYFEGSVTVEALNETEATAEAYDMLDGKGFQFSITGTEASE